MLGTKTLTFSSDKRQITLNISTILYVNMQRNVATIHTVSGEEYRTRLTLTELEQRLGEDFLKINRSALVSVMAVHNIGEQIELNNGDVLDYNVRGRRELIAQLREKQKNIIRRFQEREIPAADEVYRTHYRCFDELPIAFADIEMLFNDEKHAVDWRFRYANQALSALENVPLDELVGNTFSSFFSNMNIKWLLLYERAVLYHETLEVVDHSPEIDTDLRVVCFPTFPGHCGCLLFPVSRLRFTRISDEGSAALLRYFRTLLDARSAAPRKGRSRARRGGAKRS